MWRGLPVSEVRGYWEQGPSLLPGLQLSGPALNLRSICFKYLLSGVILIQMGYTLLLLISSFLHYDAGNWVLVMFFGFFAIPYFYFSLRPFVFGLAFT